MNMVSGIISKRSDIMLNLIDTKATIEAVGNIYRFIWILRFRIKLMSEKDFYSVIKTLDSDSALYALFLRYI